MGIVMLTNIRGDKEMARFEMVFEGGLSQDCEARTLDGAKREATKCCSVGYGSVNIIEFGMYHSDILPLAIKKEAAGKWEIPE